MSPLRLRPLGFGEILDGAFTLYRRNFAVFFTTALIASIPVALVTRSVEVATIGTTPEATPDPAAVGTILVAIPLTGLIWLLLWGALTWQTARRYEGYESSVRDGYGKAFRSLPRFIGSGIIILLLALAVGTALAIAMSVIAVTLAAFDGAAWVGGLYGGVTVLLWTVVTVAAMTSLFALVPATMLDDLGPWAAIKRSHRLARGARGRIVGIVLVSSLIVLLPTIGLAVGAGMGAAMWDVTAAATLSPAQLFVQQFVAIITTALTTPFMVGCITLLYFDRRVRTEGYDLEVAADALSEHALS